MTTPALGHFNVFPLPDGAPVVNWRPRNWEMLGRSIAEAAPDAVVVLNHARDTHGGFAPFEPRRHVSVAGESVDGRVPPVNAMEVVNSGATRAEPMDLLADWFGMLNRGRRLTPIGASDSHDVSRYIVAQARTYVGYKATDDPSKIDPARAAAAIREGRVSVSYGLLTHLAVAGRFTAGELATAVEDSIGVHVRVLGPEWVTASRVALYANGVEVRRAEIPPAVGDGPQPAPVKWEGRWTLPRPRHDVHLVAVSSGPGVDAPYWPMAKPYQPTSPRWRSYVLGATGAVFVDCDGDGRFNSAHDYATRIVERCAAAAGGDVDELAARLADDLRGYDEAVAAQAASILRSRDAATFETVCRRLIDTAAPPAARGLGTYLEQWKQTTR